MNDIRNQDSQKTNTLRARVARGNTLAYLQSNRGKRQYSPPPSAARAVNKVLRPLSKKFGSDTASLNNYWRHIIGERWAALSSPKALRGNKGSLTLIIEAKGPAAALMQADTTNIMAKVNQFLGAKSVVKIIIKQGRIQKPTNPSIKVPVKANHEQLKSPENQDVTSLKDALDKFGSKIKRRENS